MNDGLPLFPAESNAIARETLARRRRGIGESTGGAPIEARAGPHQPITTGRGAAKMSAVGREPRHRLRRTPRTPTRSNVSACVSRAQAQAEPATLFCSRRRERGVDAALSRPRLGQGGGGPAYAGARQAGRSPCWARSNTSRANSLTTAARPAVKRLRRASRATDRFRFTSPDSTQQIVLDEDERKSSRFLCGPGLEAMRWQRSPFGPYVCVRHWVGHRTAILKMGYCVPAASAAGFCFGFVFLPLSVAALAAPAARISSSRVSRSAVRASVRRKAQKPRRLSLT